jgi:hypothetical protein
MRPEDANNKYQVLIYNRQAAATGMTSDPGRPTRTIWAHCPESGMKMTFASQWSSPIEDLFKTQAGAALGGGIETIAGAAGFHISDQLLTALMWKGSRNPVFQMDLEFHAETDSKTDVIGRVADLCKLVLPTQVVPGVLSTPGPDIIDRLAQRMQEFNIRHDNGLSPQSSGGKAGWQTSIHWGANTYFDDVVVTSVDILLPAVFGADGYPTYCKVGVQFQQFLTPYAGDVNKIFGVSSL